MRLINRPEEMRYGSGKAGRGGIDNPQALAPGFDSAADLEVYQCRAGQSAAERSFRNPAELSAFILKGEQQEFLDQADCHGCLEAG